MNGNLLRHTVAAFRLIPYIQREDLECDLESKENIEAENELEDADNINSDSESSID